MRAMFDQFLVSTRTKYRENVLINIILTPTVSKECFNSVYNPGEKNEDVEFETPSGNFNIYLRLHYNLAWKDLTYFLIRVIRIYLSTQEHKHKVNRKTIK